MDKLYIKIKRAIDTILAIILIIILSPLFIIISVAIKLDSPGPILFRQKRVGLYCKTFTLLKFRSMDKDNDILDFDKGDRITKVGHFIRSTSLDELPQIFNILSGDMSFIGPRPWVTECYKYFTDEQKKRNFVRPGVTGVAQVSGRKDLNILKRIEHDIIYVDNISISLDIKIFLKTILVVFKKSNNTRENYTFEDELRDLKNHYIYHRGGDKYEN